MSDPSPDELVEVRLVGLPIPLYRQAAEHHDELRRELALIGRHGPDDRSVPARLQAVIDELEARFGAFTASSTGALRQALAQGEERIDLVYRVPAQAGEASLELDALLEEADAFCREGAHLLTLTTPPGPLAFRRWFLGEFVTQAGGGEPTSWDDYAARS